LFAGRSALGGPRASDANSDSLRPSTVIAATTQQPLLFGTTCVISGQDRAAILDDPHTYDASWVFKQAIYFAFEGLEILLADQEATFDLSSDRLDQLQVVKPDAPLRHS
jgi:hypothetical protein